MSNDLVTTGGGAIIPAAGTGGAVGEHVGDVSLERGNVRAPEQEPSAWFRQNAARLEENEQAARDARGPQLIVNDLLPRLNLTEDQRQTASAWFRQNAARLEELYEDKLIGERLALDKREQAAAIATVRGRWGAAAYEGNVRKIHEWLLDTLGADATEELMRARDIDGTAIFNKPEVLEAMLEAGRLTLSSDDTADRAAAEQALKAEWRGTYDASIALARRYLDSLPQTVQDALHWARDSHGVLLLNRPEGMRWLVHVATRRPSSGGGAPAPDLSARRREIESWMEAPRDSANYRKYWSDPAVQTEYRELLDQGAAADVTRSTADTDVEARIAQIEAWMGARRGSTEYKNYWNNAAIQTEYANLLARRR